MWGNPFWAAVPCNNDAIVNRHFINKFDINFCSMGCCCCKKQQEQHKTKQNEKKNSSSLDGHSAGQFRNILKLNELYSLLCKFCLCIACS